MPRTPNRRTPSGRPTPKPSPNRHGDPRLEDVSDTELHLPPRCEIPNLAELREPQRGARARRSHRSPPSEPEVSRRVQRREAGPPYRWLSRWSTLRSKLSALSCLEPLQLRAHALDLGPQSGFRSAAEREIMAVRADCAGPVAVQCRQPAFFPLLGGQEGLEPGPTSHRAEGPRQVAARFEETSGDEVADREEEVIVVPAGPQQRLEPLERGGGIGRAPAVRHHRLHSRH